jgi:hypothetical protein
MSDIIFVCVSADLDLAEALADVFETAGHTIGDDEENAAATIVLWSHASRRSRAFLDAAKRATDDGTALVVSRDALPAGSIEGAPVFDLADWDGDPDSAIIDPLFNAVDRKLIIARSDSTAADSGAGAEEVEPDFAPPRTRASFGAWKRGASGLGNSARALAVLAVLAGGALSASLAFSSREPVARVARVAIEPASASEAYATAPAENAAMHVTFAEAVQSDASSDEVASPPPPPLGVPGREPPSASSLPRRERARWRDAAYVPETTATIQPASYQSERSAPLDLTPPASAKQRDAHK